VTRPETQHEDAITLLAVGPKEVGKTHLAMRWALDLEKNGRHTCLCHTPDPKVIGRRWNSIAEFRRSTPWAKINVFPSALYTPTEVAQLAVSVGPRRRVVLWIDEIDTAITPHAYNDPPPRRGEPRKPGPLRQAMHEGRHNRVDFIGCCRRLSNVHRDVRTLAHAIAIFRTNDLEGLPPHVQREVLRLNPETFDHVIWYPNLLRPVELHKSGVMSIGPSAEAPNEFT